MKQCTRCGQFNAGRVFACTSNTRHRGLDCERALEQIAEIIKEKRDAND
jgi:hypothetical protein